MRVGTADDHDESDADAILTFWEAQTQAKIMALGDQDEATRKAQLSVGRAAVVYIGSLEARNRRTANDARLRLNRLPLPRFGASHIADLTRTTLEGWRDGLVRIDRDAEQRRKSQDTANRVLSIVKALLNHAVGDPANGLSNDSAWRVVRPFQRVGQAREVHFESADVAALLEGCRRGSGWNLKAA